MYKKFFTVVLAIVLFGNASAQFKKNKDQSADPIVDEWNDVEVFEQHKLYPRANVIPYGNENAIEKNGYESSPYYISLNGEWRMKLSSSFNNRPTNIEQKDFSAKDWATVIVPSARILDGKKLLQSKKILKPSDVSESGNNVATYYREFEVPKAWKDYKSYLNIQAH